MYKNLLSLLFLVSVGISAQSVAIVDPVIDNSLKLPEYFGYDQPIYLVNEHYVVYQENEKRIHINADMASFRFSKFDQSGYFALDKNGIYFRGKLIAADTTGFKIVAAVYNEDYQAEKQVLWKTANTLYSNDEIVTGNIDVATFKSAGYATDRYFKDKDFIYYGTQKIEGSDAKTAGNSLEKIIFDKNHVYLLGKIATYKGENITPVNESLMKTSKFVLNLHFQEQKGIDPATLVRLSRHYSKDKNNLYQRAEKSPVKNLALKNIKVWDQVNRSYFTDGVRVYAGLGMPEPEFDAKTFGMLPHSDFCYDKNGIYERQYNDKLGKVFNVKFPFKYTAKVSPQNMFITNNSLYVIYENQAYSPWEKKMFTLTAGQIALARQNKLLLADNPKGMQIAESYDYLLTKTDGKIYWKGTQTSADGATFERVAGFYKDKTHFYRYDRGRGLLVMDGIDPATARVQSGFLVDKNSVYWYHFRVIKSEGFEVLGICRGYRQGCGLDTQPGSNYYILKNTDGYWLALISDTVKISPLGKVPDENIRKRFGLK